MRAFKAFTDALVACKHQHMAHLRRRRPGHRQPSVAGARCAVPPRCPWRPPQTRTRPPGHRQAHRTPLRAGKGRHAVEIVSICRPLLGAPHDTAGSMASMGSEANSAGQHKGTAASPPAPLLPLALPPPRLPRTCQREVGVVQHGAQVQVPHALQPLHVILIACRRSTLHLGGGLLSGLLGRGTGGAGSVQQRTT